MNIKYLEENYSALLNNNDSSDSCEIYSLLFILHELNYEQYKYYSLSKKFLAKYIRDINEHAYGYDVININKLLNILNLFSGKEKLSLTEYYINTLKKADINIDIHKLIVIRNKCLYQQLRDNFTLPNLSAVIFKIFLSSIRKLFYILILSTLICYLIFLPSLDCTFPIFDIKFEGYSDNLHLNILYNVIAILLSVDNEFQINPLNNWGAPLIFLGKSFYIIVIAGSIGQYILSLLQKLKDEV